MILAAGLSPAWQQIVLLDQLRLGEVNRAREVHWCASGKVVNVGIALAQLGASSLMLSVAGGLPGEAMDRDLESLAVPRRWIPSSAASRVCTTLLDQATGQTTELVENASALGDGELAAFVAAYAEAIQSASAVVLTGSLPAGTPEGFYHQLLSVTRCPAILDVRGPELTTALAARPLVVKPNRAELAATVGSELESDADLIAAMNRLREQGAAWVVITQGAAAVWAAGPEGTFRLTPPTVEVVNPIACGDCLAAGISWGIADGADCLEAIKLGMGAAAQNAAMLLPARLNADHVRRLAAGIAAEQV